MEITITNVSLALSLSACVSLLGYIIKMSAKFGRLELKVDTMWAFQMRRAMSEVVESGIGSLNSPLIFNEDAKRALDPLRSELVNFAAKLQINISDGELLLEIEHEFGDRLLMQVCVPCKLSHGACLLLAMAIAKQSDKIDIHL